MRSVLFALCLIGLLLSPLISEAACGGASPTWTAASAAYSDVNACVTVSVNGDTINVPAGAATWTSSLLDIHTKDLTLHGAGHGSNPAVDTIITASPQAACIKVAVSGTSGISRITNFRFVNCFPNMRGLTPTKPFRIDNNYFDGAGTSDGTLLVSAEASIATSLPPQGLFDHNTFTQVRFNIQGTDFVVGDDGMARQHHLWSLDPGFGGVQAVYIEDNTIPLAAHLVNGVVDCNSGGRYVVRFNTITMPSNYPFEVHGVQGANRACQRFEMYNNILTNTGATQSTIALARGGSGFQFNNALSGYDNGMGLYSERATITKPPMNLCDGTDTPSLTIDGNAIVPPTAGAGYPCRDQPGRPMDSSLYTGNYTGSAGSGIYPSQALAPVYTWSNLDGATQKLALLHLSGAAYMVEERDFYNFSSAAGSPQTVGVRVGTLANIPAGCTAGVGYWATDQGSWNSTTTNSTGVQANGADGVFYKCTATNTWSVLYTPYTYPHPLQGITTPPAPVGVTGLRVVGASTATTATLVWVADSTAGVVGYKIYCSPATGGGGVLVGTRTLADVTTKHKPVTQFTFVSPVARTCYFTVKSYDATDLLSAASSEVLVTYTGMTRTAVSAPRGGH